MPTRFAWATGAAIAAAVTATVVLLVIVPGVVRDRVIAQAAARGVNVSATKVKLGWLTVELRDVAVQLEGVDGVDVRFASVLVGVDLHLHPVRFALRGGDVSVRDADGARDRINLWRARHPSSSGPSPSSRAFVDVEVETFVASGFGDGQLTARGVKVRRSPDELRVSVGSLEARQGHVGIKATDGSAEFDGSPASFRSATLVSATVIWTLPPKVEVADAPPNDLPPPVEARLPAKGKRTPLPKEEPTSLPRLVPDLRAMRAALGAVVAAAVGRLPDGSNLRVDSLSVRVQRGEDELALGSGRFDVDRDARRIELAFSTSPLGQGTPFSLRADLPTDGGDFEASASGGPVSLGLLGMHDGGLLHLLDVDHTTFAGRGRVVLDDKASSVTFDVEGAVHGLSMRDPRLAHDPVRGMDLSVRARGVAEDKGDLRLDEAEASLGAARATLHGGFSQTPDRISAAFDFDFPTASCEALLTSVPSALLPTVGGARMDGTFGLRGRLAFDTHNLDGTAFEYDVNDRCRLVDVPSALDRGRFARTFSHVVYSKTGELEDETTGPGSASWTDLDDISPYMQTAVLTTEDGAFFHHHGFSHAAIRHALIDDIKARRFIRGASTITMQLAKNLFLSREKTLSRKLEELVLADYLEQTFTKDEMMELYLNVIEFGPDIYGVTRAADHYFGRRPNELTAAECMFLSSILPSPIAFHKAYEKSSQLNDGWMRTIRARLQVAAKNGLLSPAELAEGLTETVSFHHDGDPPPAPRQPVTTPARRENGAEWEELN